MRRNAVLNALTVYYNFACDFIMQKSYLESWHHSWDIWWKAERWPLCLYCVSGHTQGLNMYIRHMDKSVYFCHLHYDLVTLQYSIFWLCKYNIMLLLEGVESWVRIINSAIYFLTEIYNWQNLGELIIGYTWMNKTRNLLMLSSECQWKKHFSFSIFLELLLFLLWLP